MGRKDNIIMIDSIHSKIETSILDILILIFCRLIQLFNSKIESINEERQ